MTSHLKEKQCQKVSPEEKKTTAEKHDAEVQWTEKEIQREERCKEMKEIISRVENREILLTSNKKSTEQEIHENLITKGEDRKKINEERLKNVEEKAKKEENIQDLLVKSLQETQQARKKEEERADQFLVD